MAGIEHKGYVYCTCALQCTLLSAFGKRNRRRSTAPWRTATLHAFKLGSDSGGVALVHKRQGFCADTAGPEAA